MNKQVISNEIAKKIRELLRDVTFEIKDETLIESIGLNSISFIKILVFIEDTYDVEFDDIDLIIENYITFKDIIDKIESLYK